MFSTKKVIVTAMLGSAIALPVSTLFTSAAYADDNAVSVTATEDKSVDIAQVDVAEAVVNPYALNINDYSAILGVQPGNAQVFDLTKIFDTAQTATFQLADQVANLPQINGWKLSVDGNNLTVIADGDRAPLPVSFGVNVTDEQGKVVQGVLSAFTDDNSIAYTDVQQGVNAMREAVNNGLTAIHPQVENQTEQTEGVDPVNVVNDNGEQAQPDTTIDVSDDTSGESDRQDEQDAEAQYGPKVDTGGNVDTGIVANIIKSIFA